MNRRREAAVEPRVRNTGLVIPVALALLCTGSAACIEVDGGAIELAWSLRDFSGGPLDNCAQADIEEIRILWVTDGASLDSKTVLCRRERAVTGFDVVPGEASIWIEPVCADGQPADEGTYQVPAPIVRTVRTGEVVTLNALLIVASNNDDPDVLCPAAGCTCQR